MNADDIQVDGFGEAPLAEVDAVVPEVQEVRILRLQPGDLLVLETPHVLSSEAVKRMRRSVKKMGDDLGLPDLKAVILEDGLRLAALLVSDGRMDVQVVRREDASSDKP